MLAQYGHWLDWFDRHHDNNDHDGTDGRRGLGLSLGSELATAWRFPLGISGSGRQDRIVLANPSGQDARVTLSFALDAALEWANLESSRYPSLASLPRESSIVSSEYSLRLSLRRIYRIAGATTKPKHKIVHPTAPSQSPVVAYMEMSIVGIMITIALTTFAIFRYKKWL